MRTLRVGLLGLCVAAGLLSWGRGAEAWSHQGHILITRMALVRIIEDPASPKGLREFLQSQVKSTQADCEKLATTEMVGAEPKSYLEGMDGACTWPDRVQQLEEGKKLLEPYGMAEQKMHFLDMEFFAQEVLYKPDRSCRPKLEDFPRDTKNWRYQQAGFLPFRVEEYYKKSVAALGKAGEPVNVEEATKSLGYLVHYLEDAHQPHHSTIDFKSLSYLAGKVPGVKEIKTPLQDGTEAISYKADRKVNPHGDIEFQIFENAEEPRAGLRKELWKELNARIDSKAKKEWSLRVFGEGEKAGEFDGFAETIRILSESYGYLPTVGKAAVAAYAEGKFDAKAFFNSEDTVHREKMTMVQVIADRKAEAVLEVERVIRRAWADAKAGEKK